MTPETPLAEPKLPRSLEPMRPRLATLQDIPRNNTHEWLVERKYDGMRARTLVSPQSGVIITTSGSRNVTSRFPELHFGLNRLASEHTAVLDGEITFGVGIDASDRLRVVARSNSNNRFLTDEEFRYRVFDLVYLDGEDLTRKPLTERKERLRDLLAPLQKYYRRNKVKPVKTYELTKITQLISNIETIGGEGIVLKRKSSIYRAGESRDWLKIKL